MYTAVERWGAARGGRFAFDDEGSSAASAFRFARASLAGSAVVGA